MSRVLLAWELGAGIGYTEWLVQIGRALKQESCRPILALRDLQACWSLIAESSLPAVQAPFIQGRLNAKARKEGFQPTSFADLMACNGFSSLEQLASMVRAWEGLIDLVRPQVIVGAYCPVLGLAAYDRVPLILTGYAYTLPPADEATFPVFNPSIPPYSDQAKLFDLVKQVQELRGERAPERLTDIHRGDRRFVLTFPELDPYRQQRREPPVGPLEDLGTEIVPPPSEPRFYAYLVGDKPIVPKLIEGLLACGLPGAIYLRDSAMRPSVDPKTKNVAWLARPPPLSQAVTQATVVIHHGGANTFHWALGAGRPQIVAPRVMDQTLTANEGQRLGLAVKLAPDASPEQIAQIVRQTAEDGDMHERVADYARGVRRRGVHNSLSKVVEACLDFLP